MKKAGCLAVIRSKPSCRWSVETWCRRISSLRGAADPTKSAVLPLVPKARLEDWDKVLSDPSQWWDNMPSESHPDTPDFSHSTKDGFWLDPQHAWIGLKPRTTTTDGSCGAPYKHRFDREGCESISKNRGTWSSIFKEGQLSEAVEALDMLLQEGSYVDCSLFYCILKRCIARRDLVLGKRVHALILNSGYASNVFLANHIICMYGSHGRLDEVAQVFSQVVAPDRYMWASIILAHTRHGQPVQAIRLYRQMRDLTVRPDNHIFAAVLKACSTAVDLASGREVHADILGSALQPDLFVSSCLVDMYAKCGSLEDAQRVFDKVPIKDVVTWTAMIAGYTEHGLGQEALSLYDRMQKEGIILADSVVFVCLLKACALAKSLQHGKQLHSQILERGLEVNLVVGNSLVGLYSKCSSLLDARRVFDSMTTRDVVTWNCMLTAYADHGLDQEALTLYASMQNEGIILPDNVTFIALLKACTSMQALHMGQQLHAQIQEKGLEGDVVVGSCLVGMYAKCRSLQNARQVFDRLPTKDVVTWTAMITGYADNGLGKEALSAYTSMQEEGIILADSVTFVCLLKACASLRDLMHGRLLHSQVLERGLEVNVVMANCLVDMYGKCGSLMDARKVFDSLRTRDVVTWNSLILGYVEHGQCQEALTLYDSMTEEGILPNRVTLVGVLKACSSVGALHLGKKLHATIQGSQLEADVVVGNSLVDMYGKCGSLLEARRVLERLPRKDVITWNALLNGYAQHSDGQMAIKCFAEMREQGIKPDDVTFTCILVACSHGGLVDEGWQFFKIMSEDYGVVPTVQHYTCMVDLLGRSGCLDEAENLWRSVPFENDVVGWTSLLSACKIHGDIERAKLCFDRLIQLDPENGTAYVLLANLYAGAGRWADAQSIESLRKSAGAKKKPATACIEVKQVVHEFTLGEERSDVSSKLRSMNLTLKDRGGHVPHTELVMKALSDSEKEDALCGHAEKLALAYGLLNTPDGTPLLVTKNLRMCNDCHSATKILSRLEKRAITVRDSHRVHNFLNGVCSCGDRH